MVSDGWTQDSESVQVCKLFWPSVCKLRGILSISIKNVGCDFCIHMFTRFDQKSTSVISLLSLTSALFHKHRNSAGNGTALSQLLVIISDGRGIFHEGKEKVIQVKTKLLPGYPNIGGVGLSKFR